MTLSDYQETIDDKWDSAREDLYVMFDYSWLTSFFWQVTMEDMYREMVRCLPFHPLLGLLNWSEVGITIKEQIPHEPK